MKYISVFIAAVLLFSLCIVPVVADESDEGWEQYFFLPENSRDIKRMDKDINWNEVKQDLQQYDAQLDFSKAYICYTGYINNTPGEDYKYNSERATYDGVPEYWGERIIIIPAYSNKKLIIGANFWDISPSLEEAPIYSEPVGGFETLFLYQGLTINAGEVYKNYVGAEKAYETVQKTGASIKKIMASYQINNVYFLVTVDDECGGYIYNYTTDKLYTFEEFTNGLARGDWPTPEPTPTPTPTPTPRPSRTMATPSPTVVTPTATPSAGETATPVLTATASLWPAPSSAPGQNTGGTALIALGIVFACAALGLAVFFAVKNWRIKP